MSLFARIVRFFTLAQPKRVTVRALHTSQVKSKVDETRRRLQEKRTAREGGWDETQFFKPD